MKKRATRLTLNLVKSTYTGIVYLALFEDSVPVKFWPYDSVNKAGLNIISELFKGFDLGYDIEFQFPRELKGERKLQKTILKIKKKYGRNSVLKGMNISEGATARERNEQIRGHKK